MSTFYEIYLKLCNENAVSPSKAALDIGISKTSVTRWKQGYCPTDANLRKIANYFGVTVEYLRGETENSSDNSELNKSDSSPEVNKRIKELYNLTNDMTDSELNALRAFVAGLKANRKQD